MSFPIGSILFFSLSFIAALAMIIEGSFIALLKKQVTPLPTRILYGLGFLLVGGEKSRHLFLGRASSKDLRVYALFVLILGPVLLLSSISYLFTTIL